MDTRTVCSSVVHNGSVSVGTGTTATERGFGDQQVDVGDGLGTPNPVDSRGSRGRCTRRAVRSKGDRPVPNYTAVNGEALVHG